MHVLTRRIGSSCEIGTMSNSYDEIDWLTYVRATFWIILIIVVVVTTWSYVRDNSTKIANNWITINELQTTAQNLSEKLELSKKLIVDLKVDALKNIAKISDLNATLADLRKQLRDDM